ASVKELLQPGRAATAERELYAELASVRSGRVDEVVRALRARLVDTEPPDDGPLHDRIITALAFGRRWREAATHYATPLPAHRPPGGGGARQPPGVGVQVGRRRRGAGRAGGGGAVRPPAGAGGPPPPRGAPGRAAAGPPLLRRPRRRRSGARAGAVGERSHPP